MLRIFGFPLLRDFLVNYLGDYLPATSYSSKEIMLLYSRISLLFRLVSKILQDWKQKKKESKNNLKKHMISIIERNLPPPVLTLWFPELPLALFRQCFREKARTSVLLFHLWVPEIYRCVPLIITTGTLLNCKSTFHQPEFDQKLSSLCSQHPDQCVWTM